LTPLELFFHVGDNFAFAFRNTDPSGGDIGTAFSVLGDLASGLGPYPYGQAFLRNNEQVSGEFFEWATTTQTVDLGFRTYVVPVPEPATLTLMVLILMSTRMHRWKGENTLLG
jgi:hypothetical protein